MTRSSSARSRLVRALGATAALAGALVVAGPAGSASAAACSDIEIVFARGSTELPGLGLAGTPFVSSLTSALPGKTVTSYAVNYAADIAQTSSGAGSTDLTKHVVATNASCPNTKFVLGGYSQGATVVDKSIGISFILGGAGTALPASIEPKVAAVVVFGNPIGIFGQKIETSSQTYGGRALSFCNSGDPVCGGGGNVIAHLQYGTNGSATQGAQFAAAKISGTG